MHGLKHVMEALSFVTAIYTIAGWLASALPPVAAAASIAWIGFQFYHSEPMKERRERKRIEREKK